MRGEDVFKTANVFQPFGSPPHAWGRLCDHIQSNLVHRFTPTCVGKTWRKRSSTHLVSVHPHMRGEDAPKQGPKQGPPGSPPHAWGRPGAGGSNNYSLRFTPTCVGKTTIEIDDQPPISVHPHMRGEDVSVGLCKTEVNGSPPHAWGRRNEGGQLAQPHRFTPTCVGKTARVAGTMPSPVGSPPHAWGRLKQISTLPRRTRFTPTCVGKTRPVLTIRIATPVHPHMRGEDSSGGVLSGNPDGSPPHAWGRPKRPQVLASGVSVHPHMRGEDGKYLLGWHKYHGSPPHAWGRRLESLNPTFWVRFTPTCVGKTLCASLGLWSLAVHPHMRGEDDGRPPFVLALVRFTPTCVGKTFFLVGWLCILPVHPHMRGEDVSFWPSLRSLSGSPPHAWGRLIFASNSRLFVRFTPTCVGKTQSQ